MAIDTKPEQLSESLNNANPNTVPDALRALKFGNHLLQQKTRLMAAVPAAIAGYDATLRIVKLPEMAKAAKILSARGYPVGAGVALVLQAGVTPIAGEIAVTGSGDIAVLAADAYATIDVLYEPEIYDVVELTLPVASNVATLPTSVDAIMLLESTALTGTAPGVKIVNSQSDTAPLAGLSRLTSKGLTVAFAVADAVTSCRVKLAIARASDVQKTLVAASAIS